jgi:hypothetical protein
VTVSDDVFTIESPFRTMFLPFGGYSITIPHDSRASGALLALDSACFSDALHINYSSNPYQIPMESIPIPVVLHILRHRSEPDYQRFQEIPTDSDSFRHPIPTVSASFLLKFSPPSTMRAPHV